MNILLLLCVLAAVFGIVMWKLRKDVAPYAARKFLILTVIAASAFFFLLMLQVLDQ